MATHSPVNPPHQYQLTNSVLGFALSAVLALLPLLNNSNVAALDAILGCLDKFAFFLVVAFGTSLAAVTPRCQQGRAASLCRCLAVLSFAMAYASVASLFLRRRWLKVIAYVLCSAAPLLMLEDVLHVRLVAWFDEARKWLPKKCNQEEAVVDLERGGDVLDEGNE